MRFLDVIVGRETEDKLGIAQRLARSFRTLAILMALALVVGIATLTVVLAVDQPQLSRASDGREAARLSDQGMLDEDAAVHAFLLDDDSRLLDQYRAGQALVARGDADVAANVGSNSQVAPLIAATRRAELAWTQSFAAPLVASPPPSGAAAIAALQRGARLLDAYQSAVGAEIAGITSVYDDAHRDETLALAIGAALQVVLFSVMLRLVIGQYRGLRAALAGSFQDLVRTIRRVRDGDLAARAAEDGPAEARQAAAGLNEMTHALAEERTLRASRETEVMYQATRLRELLEMARDLASSLDLHYVLDAAAGHAVSVSGHEQATVWLKEDDPRRLVAVRTAAAAGAGPAEREPLDVGEGVVGQAARDGSVVTGDAGQTSDPPGVSLMAVPMLVGAQAVGVLELSSSIPYAVPPAALSLLEILASHAGTAIEAARLHAHTEELTQVDALTRLFNRRRLEADLDRECKRSRRYDRPLAFCMLDVDHFKTFNDRYGHRRGDAVLEEVGNLLRSGLRSSDSAFRYGGEEFGLLLRDTTLGAAVALCERLRVGVAESFTAPQRITASFGVAVLQPGMATPEDFIEAADRALYQAKSAGRNCVVAAEATQRPG